MNNLFSLRLARLSKRGYRVTLVAALLVVALVFGVFSYAPVAHPISNFHGSVLNAQLQTMTHETIPNTPPPPMEE